MKLALGTAQLGLNYGATNPSGQISGETFRKILLDGCSFGLDTIDTASLYGNAEFQLGELGISEIPVKVVTKTPKNLTRSSVHLAFQESLRLMKINSVYGLMVHDVQDLLGPQGAEVWTTLSEMQANHRVSRVGVSLYEPFELEEVLRRFPVQLVQIPINVLDQKWLKGDLLKRAKSMGVEIHVRSIFLQGLLALPIGSEIPHIAKGFSESLNRFWDLCHSHGISRLDGALEIVAKNPWVDRIVVGVTSVAEWVDIRESFERVLTRSGQLNWDSVECDNSKLVDPRYWNK